MQQTDPDGFALRLRRKKRDAACTQLTAAGPFDHVHADETENLSQCGVPIYVIRDRATSGILFMNTRPNVLRALPVRLMFLECMENLSGKVEIFASRSRTAFLIPHFRQESGSI